MRSLQNSPEEQRVPRAAAHLQTLIFSRLSDDHVVALALLPTLNTICTRAYRTAQVVQANYLTQDAALETHLRTLELPLTLSELSAEELAQLIAVWSKRTETLPHPFRDCVETLLASARALTQHATNRA